MYSANTFADVIERLPRWASQPSLRYAIWCTRNVQYNNLETRLTDLNTMYAVNGFKTAILIPCCCLANAVQIDCTKPQLALSSTSIWYKSKNWFSDTQFHRGCWISTCLGLVRRCSAGLNSRFNLSSWKCVPMFCNFGFAQKNFELFLIMLRTF